LIDPISGSGVFYRMRSPPILQVSLIAPPLSSRPSFCNKDQASATSSRRDWRLTFPRRLRHRLGSAEKMLHAPPSDPVNAHPSIITMSFFLPFRRKGWLTPPSLSAASRASPTQFLKTPQTTNPFLSGRSTASFFLRKHIIPRPLVEDSSTAVFKQIGRPPYPSPPFSLFAIFLRHRFITSCHICRIAELFSPPQPALLKDSLSLIPPEKSMMLSQRSSPFPPV